MNELVTAGDGRTVLRTLLCDIAPLFCIYSIQSISRAPLFDLTGLLLLTDCTFGDLFELVRDFLNSLLILELFFKDSMQRAVTSECRCREH